VAGERVNHVLGEVPEWVPVLAPGGAAGAAVDRAAVEARAGALELVAVRWPEPFPFDSRVAMLAATFAKQSGRAVAFSLAAMRQAFAAGRDLSEVDNVLIAAAACEIHPRALLKGVELRMVAEDLDRASEAAAGLELPAVLDRDGRTLPRERFL
jgi:2-hydroxychromene-2-carboxylate isomerase